MCDPEWVGVVSSVEDEVRSCLPPVGLERRGAAKVGHEAVERDEGAGCVSRLSDGEKGEVGDKVEWTWCVDEAISPALSTVTGDGSSLGDPWSSGHGWEVSKGGQTDRKSNECC